MKRVRHVVFTKREGLRFFFMDTQYPERGDKQFMISFYPKDIVYLFYGGLFLLLPPFKKSHIKFQ